MSATRTERQRINDYEAITAKIREFGCGLKEPELVAACALSEDRVRLAVRWALKLGYLERNELGEIVRADVLGLCDCDECENGNPSGCVAC